MKSRGEKPNKVNLLGHTLQKQKNLVRHSENVETLLGLNFVGS